MDAPWRQDLNLRVEVTRYLRSEIDGKEIWSDYYQKVPKPKTDTSTLAKECGYRLGEKYVGALIRDDEKARAFIERMKMGFAAMEDQMQAFLSQDRIAESIEKALAGPGTLLLETSSD